MFINHRIRKKNLSQQIIYMRCSGCYKKQQTVLRVKLVSTEKIYHRETLYLKLEQWYFETEFVTATEIKNNTKPINEKLPCGEVRVLSFEQPQTFWCFQRLDSKPNIQYNNNKIAGLTNCGQSMLSWKSAAQGLIQSVCIIPVSPISLEISIYLELYYFFHPHIIHGREKIC